MREANTLDLVYTNIPGVYQAKSLPHIGYSDHITVMLFPRGRLLIRCSKLVLKQLRTWPEEAISALHHFFEHTDWHMFKEAATNGEKVPTEPTHQIISDQLHQ